MQRGILKLNIQEVQELLKAFDITKYSDKPLYSKFTSISTIGEQEQYQIMLSEDELEIIMDEVGFVDQNTNPILSSAIKKISDLLVSFRTS